MTHPASSAPAPVVHLPHNVDLPIIFYQGQPVITLAMMDKAHQRPEGTAYRNFNTHQDKLIKDEDYFHLSQDEMKSFYEFRRTANPKGLILLTETGYLMLVKSFTDDLAWQVQRELVKNYFRKADKYETSSRSSDIRMHYANARIDIELQPDNSGDIHYVGLTRSNAADMLRVAVHAVLKVSGVNCGEDTV